MIDEFNKFSPEIYNQVKLTLEKSNNFRFSKVTKVVELAWRGFVTNVAPMSC